MSTPPLPRTPGPPAPQTPPSAPRRGLLIGGALGLVLLLLVGAAVVLSLRADSDGELDDLIARVTGFGDPQGMVTAFDLAAGREAAGLPEDFSPRDGFGRDDPAERRFLNALQAVPALQSARATPVNEAIDDGLIIAAATTHRFGPGNLTVLRTTQNFDDIAAALEAGGFERDGDVLSYTGDDLVQEIGAAHVAGHDGLVALTTDPDGVGPVEEAVTEPAPDPTDFGELVLDVLDHTDGPGLTVASPPDVDCVLAAAIIEPVDGSTQQLVLVAADDPETIELTLDAHLTESGVELDDPEIDGDRVSVTLRHAPDNASGWFGLLQGELPAGSLWSCG